MLYPLYCMKQNPDIISKLVNSRVQTEQENREETEVLLTVLSLLQQMTMRRS